MQRRLPSYTQEKDVQDNDVSPVTKIERRKEKKHPVERKVVYIWGAHRVCADRGTLQLVVSRLPLPAHPKTNQNKILLQPFNICWELSQQTEKIK